MNKKYLDFIRNSKEITDKNKAIENFITYAINKLESMFEYKNLPDTIPQKWLEYYLMVNGNCFITKVNNKLYAFTGGLGGEWDVYYQPTKYIVNNPYLNFNKECIIDKDGILIRNDTMMNGMKPILSKYGTLIVESDITMRIALINYRIHNVISASDDKTNESAKQYLQDIENGKLGTIGENAFFDGVKIQESATMSGYFTQIIETMQYIKASFYNEIGLNSSYNMKREYVSETENLLNDDILLPLVDNMLNERKEGIDKINNMFGTDIEVDFSSSWKTNNTENKKQVVENETTIKENR